MFSSIKNFFSKLATTYLAFRHRLSILIASLLLLIVSLVLCLPFISTYQTKVDQDLSHEFDQLEVYFTGQTNPLLSANSYVDGYFEETDQAGHDQVNDLNLYYFPSGQALQAIEASNQSYFVFLPDQYFYRLSDGQAGQGAYPIHWQVPTSMDRLLEALKTYKEEEQAQSRFLTLLAFRHLYFAFIVFAYAFLSASYLNRRRRTAFSALMNFEDCLALVSLSTLLASLLTLITAVLTRQPAILATSFIFYAVCLLAGQIKLISKK